MLLTITWTGEETQRLGLLLHKYPYRAQSFELNCGKAYVFYPEVSDRRTTAALLLDINPIDLARGKLGSSEGGLFDYVNDRPYVASSFMSTALARIFASAMAGKCDSAPELASEPLALSACLHMLPCRGSSEMAKKIFEPIGYSVETKTYTLDENFPEWGDSCYIDLSLTGTVTLSSLLNHLFVLIPVFDRQKHYWMDGSEIDKLLKHGEGWLAGHPARNYIAGRYLSRSKKLARTAIDRLAEDEPENEAEEENGADGPLADPYAEKRVSLNTKRLEAVHSAVQESGATSVIDLGCGEGKLISILLEDKQITKVAGADVSVASLEMAKRRLHYDRMPQYKKQKLSLMQASLTYRDNRFSDYDVACVVEVIEHIDRGRIPAFERVLFEFASPRTVIVTTPNKDYNSRYKWMEEKTLRHGDHRFEWTREEFASWTEHICKAFGYTVERGEIGEMDEQCGAPTQMGVFTKCA